MLLKLHFDEKSRRGRDMDDLPAVIVWKIDFLNFEEGFEPSPLPPRDFIFVLVTPSLVSMYKEKLIHKNVMSNFLLSNT